MSRVIREKIDIKKLIKYEITANKVVVEGALGSNTINVPHFLSVQVDEANKFMSVHVTDEMSAMKIKAHFAMGGTLVRLIKNGVLGVTEGFKKVFLFKGLGYKHILDKDKNILTMSLGYSHPVVYQIPTNIKAVSVKHDKLEVASHNNEDLGMFAANLIRLRKWNPYSSKGIIEENAIPYTKAVVKAKK